MTLRHPGLRTVLLSVVCAALVVSAQAIGIPAANAVMPTPTGLAPNGSTEGTIPVLSWDRVTGATSYGVQVSTSPTFSPTLWSVSATENRQAVPTVGLPAGTDLLAGAGQGRRDQRLGHCVVHPQHRRRADLALARQTATRCHSRPSRRC